MVILGVSALYHDSAAVLLVDGIIVAACQEERLTRKKHDSSFPLESIKYCLSEANLKLEDIDFVCFYEKPFLKFERILETFITYAPFDGLNMFIKSLPSWLEYKLNLKSYIRKQFKSISEQGLASHTQLKFSYHHLSHAASAYFVSPYEEAAVLCVDGVGEWESLTTWKAQGNEIKPIQKLNFPHSLGLLYTAFTYYCGFKVNSGEYKLMGLAPYGEPKYVDVILDKLIHLKDDGSFHLNMKYFCFPYSDKMINKKFDEVFGQGPRVPESELTQFYKDIAASIQKVLEKALVNIAQDLFVKTSSKNLCLAGGVALNCVANSVLLNETEFENIWVQPAAGDSGGALGAALMVWHHHLNKPKTYIDHMKNCYLGPEYSADTIEETLKSLGAKYQKLSHKDINNQAAKSLLNGNIIGWFKGRMEYGPRALGARSILADPRSPDMQKKLNLKIKFRESFRPFAPITLNEDNNFKFTKESSYMLFTAQVNSRELPAITHVDNSARLQTVTKDNGQIFHLLKEFKALSGCDTLINTSFNVRGEPIVCSPEEAYSCFMNTHMDELVIEGFYLKKEDQTNKADLPTRDFVLD